MVTLAQTVLPMDSILVFRSAERLVIVLAGTMCVYLGYRLFEKTKEKQGRFELKTGKSAVLKMSDVAPGIYFCAFGTILLGYALFARLELGEPTERTSQEAKWGRLSYSMARSFKEDDMVSMLPTEQQRVYMVLKQKEGMLQILANSGTAFAEEFHGKTIAAIRTELATLPLDGAFKLFLESASTDNALRDYLSAYKNYIAARYIDTNDLSFPFSEDFWSPHMHLDRRYKEIDSRKFDGDKLDGYYELILIENSLDESDLPLTGPSIARLQAIMVEEPYKQLLTQKQHRVKLMLLIHSYIAFYFHTYSQSASGVERN